MNAQEWSGVDTNPDFAYIFKFMGSISFAVVLLAVVVGFHRQTRRFFRFLWRGTFGLCLSSERKERRAKGEMGRARDVEKVDLLREDKKQW